MEKGTGEASSGLAIKQTTFLKNELHNKIRSTMVAEGLRMNGETPQEDGGLHIGVLKRLRKGDLLVSSY